MAAVGRIGRGPVAGAGERYAAARSGAGRCVVGAAFGARRRCRRAVEPRRRAPAASWSTTNRPTTRALPSSSSTRRRPLAISPGDPRLRVTATPTGANDDRHRASAQERGSRSAARHRRPVSSDTVPAEHLLLVCQLARVLDQEAGAADELVGLLGQDPLVALGLVLLVGRLFVLGLVLDDEALLEDDVQAGLDVLVVGLLLLLLVVALAGSSRPPRPATAVRISSTSSPLRPRRRRRRRRQSSSSSSRTSSSSMSSSVVVVDVEVRPPRGLSSSVFGALGLDLFGLALLLGRHCAAGA